MQINVNHRDREENCKCTEDGFAYIRRLLLHVSMKTHEHKYESSPNGQIKVDCNLPFLGWAVPPKFLAEAQSHM